MAVTDFQTISFSKSYVLSQAMWQSTTLMPTRIRNDNIRYLKLSFGDLIVLWYMRQYGISNRSGEYKVQISLILYVGFIGRTTFL